MKVTPPRRVTRTYTQQLIADPSRVFPLLCPVREVDWIEDWDPPVVYSHSGIAELDCVFVTEAAPHDAIWYISQHEPESGFVEMIKISPGVTACKLSIQLQPTAAGSDATVTYTHTSLGPTGDAFVDSFTESYYRKIMLDWEARINHYLTHGNALRIFNQPPH